MSIARRRSIARRGQRRAGSRWPVTSLVLVATLGSLGCAPKVQVGFDAHEAFERFHSWNWRPQQAARVSGSSEAAALAGRAAAAIALVLAERGFVRNQQDPDFTVAFEVSLVHRVEHVAVARAPYFLASKHHSPSYWIEGSDVVERRVDDLELRLQVALRDGRVVWKGGVRERVPVSEEPPLDTAIEQLLLRLPPPSSAPSPDAHPPRLARRAG